jgi:signal peptidase I
VDLNKQIQKTLNKFAVQFTKDLQKSLIKKAARYQQSHIYGALGQAFDTITFKDDSYILKFTLPSYYYWLDQNRKPGNVSEKAKEGMEEWVTRAKDKKGRAKTIYNSFMLDWQDKNLEYRNKVQNEAKSNNKKRKKWKTLEKYPRPSFEKAKKQLAFLIGRKVQADGYKSDAKGFFTEVYEDGRIKFLSDELTRITGKEVVIQLVNEFKK